MNDKCAAWHERHLREVEWDQAPAIIVKAGESDNSDPSFEKPLDLALMRRKSRGRAEMRGHANADWMNVSWFENRALVMS